MSVDETKTRSVISSACISAAFYFCVGAFAMFFDQILFWFRQGAWIPRQMWLVLTWTGWQQPPSVFSGNAQSTLDWVWAMIGNCPIAVLLSGLALTAAVTGCLTHPPAPRSTGNLRGAH
jgi:hypothetical protein